MSLTRVRGVVFDLDGTLIYQRLDFEAIRQEIGLPPGQPLLEALAVMPDTQRTRAEDVLHRHEESAARCAVALPGVPELLSLLDDRGMCRAVLTRNSRHCAELAMRAAGLSGFSGLLTRDDAPFKPDPGGIMTICAKWELSPAQILMVGDYVYDVHAGRAAGTRTVLVSHGRDWPFASEADLVIDGFEPLPAELLAWLD